MRNKSPRERIHGAPYLLNAAANFLLCKSMAAQPKCLFLPTCRTKTTLSPQGAPNKVSCSDVLENSFPTLPLFHSLNRVSLPWASALSTQNLQARLITKYLWAIFA
jgi:hypothetical protein